MRGLVDSGNNGDCQHLFEFRPHVHRTNTHDTSEIETFFYQLNLLPETNFLKSLKISVFIFCQLYFEHVQAKIISLGEDLNLRFLKLKT